MNALIQIRDFQGKQAVSARELYEKLGFDLSNWKRWYKKNITGNRFAIEGEDWVGFVFMTNGNETQDFALTIDFAKRLAMLARTEAGEKIRKYFVAIEKMARASLLPPFAERRINNIERTVHEIQQRTQTSPDYYSIMGFAALNHVRITLSIAAKLGRKATSECNKMGLPMDSIPDPRFGRVKLYPKQILTQVFTNNL